MATKKKTEIDFQKSLEELQAIVNELEHSKISLEVALEKFSRGVELNNRCQKALQKAEQKVQILLKQNGKEELVNFYQDLEE